jgi:phage gpG-like protein
MAKNRGGTESIQKKIKALNGIKSTMPNNVSNIAQKFFIANFSKQGFDDNTVERWKPIKKTSAKRVGGILVKSGRLRGSIKIKTATWAKILLESALPYSAIHNYGLRGVAFGKHPFQMPKRQFMGDSFNLRKKITTNIENTVNRVMKTK